MNSAMPAGATLIAWYCPALGAYRRPAHAAKPCAHQVRAHAHRLTQFDWLPLYDFAGAPAPSGWVLRSYFSPTEDAFYASHRTMSAKTAAQVDLVELYAPPGTAGNDHASHVPPKK